MSEVRAGQMPGPMGGFAHTLLTVLFWTDLSLISAGMTGNTKYFARISDWPREPAASTTSRYLRSQFLNLKDILNESGPVPPSPRREDQLSRLPGLSVVGQAEWSKSSTAAHFPNPPMAETQFIQPSSNCHSARFIVEGKGPGAVDGIGLDHHPRTVATLCSA